MDHKFDVAFKRSGEHFYFDILTHDVFKHITDQCQSNAYRYGSELAEMYVNGVLKHTFKAKFEVFFQLMYVFVDDNLYRFYPKDR